MSELCQKHEAEIENMKSDIDELKDKNKSYDQDVRSFLNNISEIKEAILRITILQENQAKESTERDKIWEKQSRALDKLSESSIKQAETLDKLNTKIDNTNKRVEHLEVNFESSEDRNKIDIRDIQKDGLTGWIKKNFWQVSGGTVLIFEVIKYLMTFITVTPKP